MNISTLRLQQFRNYQDATFTFADRVTVITGQNGIGKTNILEALHIVATGKSFRDPDDLLTQHNKDWWRITADYDGLTRDIRYKDTQKSFTINDKVFKRLSVNTALPVVLFEPDHLMLVHGSPQSRRKYIDNVISIITPGYATLLRRYERAMAQRNRLLKSPEIDHDQLFVWDVGLSELATKIVYARRQYIDGWNQTLTGHYQEISHSNDTINVTYSDTVSLDRYTQTLLTKLRDSFERDRLIGGTSYGPHRDDYIFSIDKKDMAHTASRGEIRTLLLALKYHEAEKLRTLHDSPALFLFDDVFSELDESRQANVLDKHKEHQIVITTTHVNAKQRKKYKIIELPSS